MELRPVTLDGARALAAARSAAAVPRRGRCRALDAGDRARRPRALRPAPGARVPAPAARHRRRDAPTRSRTRCRSSSTRSSEWGVGERLLEARLAGRGRDAAIAAEIARGDAAARLLARAGARSRIRPVVEQIVARRRITSRRRGERLGRRQGRARRTAARWSGRCPASAATSCARVTVLAGRAEAPARRVGAPARAHRRASRAAVRGGHGRPARAAGGRREVTVARIAAARPTPRRARARAPRRARRPLRPRDARAAAALLQDLGRVRRGRARRQGPDGGRREGVGRRRGSFPKEDRSPSTCSCSAERTFDELFAEPPRDGRAGRRLGRSTSRRGFGRYARRLWDGLLAREELIDR